MIQRILVASLSTKKPMLLESVFTDGNLVMADAVTLPTSRDGLLSEMVPRLTKRREQGFKVLVDEVSGDFAKMTGTMRVRLSDPHVDGRPVISVALDRYQEMKRLKSIIVPENGTGFEIPTSLIDSTSNSKGETVYNIAWEEITASHVLTVLSVYATMLNRPGSADYISQMTAAMGLKPKEPSAPDWLTAHQNAKEQPKKSLSGKKLDDGAYVL